MCLDYPVGTNSPEAENNKGSLLAHTGCPKQNGGRLCSPDPGSQALPILELSLPSHPELWGLCNRERERRKLKPFSWKIHVTSPPFHWSKMDIIMRLFETTGIMPFCHVRRQREDDTLEPELAHAAPWSRTASLQNKASADLNTLPVPREKTWCALFKRDYPFKHFDSLVDILLKQHFFNYYFFVKWPWKVNYWAFSHLIWTE